MTLGGDKHSWKKLAHVLTGMLVGDLSALSISSASVISVAGMQAQNHPPIRFGGVLLTCYNDSRLWACQVPRWGSKIQNTGSRAQFSLYPINWLFSTSDEEEKSVCECVFHISGVIQKGGGETPIETYYCVKYTTALPVVCIMRVVPLLDSLIAHQAPLEWHLQSCLHLHFGKQHII